MDLNQVFAELTKGFANFTLGNLIMIIAGCVLVYLAIAKEYEPVLLLPIGMGCIIANIPMTGMSGPMDYLPCCTMPASRPNCSR